ncbi:MAG: hypothetical protein L0229_17635 [Blastocatellia bacterium]|nr:hypothetical protein [Blastocatellia bacterium]
MNKKKYSMSLVVLAVVALTMSGCGVVNTLRAKDNLNEGVREFNKGKYDLARAKFERALELSPDMINAQKFHARTLNAQFDTTLKKGLGMETIEAFEKMIREHPDDYKMIDESLAFITKVYEKMAENTPDEENQSPEYLEKVRDDYRQKQRDTLLRRAENANKSGDKEIEAAVYHALGASYWNESYYTHSERYVRYNRPITPDVAEKMRPLVLKGHEYIQKSIQIKADQPDVWIFERLLLYEDLKIETDPARKKEIEARIKDVSASYDKYRLQQQQQAEKSGATDTSK